MGVHLGTFVLVTAFASCTFAADFPGEFEPPDCDLFPEACVDVLGPSGTVTAAFGLIEALSFSTAPAGTLASPWTLSFGMADEQVGLLFSGEPDIGPLVSPVDTNPTGSAHAFGRFFSLTLTNTGALPWEAVLLDLSAEGFPRELDAVSFADAEPPFIDLLPDFSSTVFPFFFRVIETDQLVYFGGLVRPGKPVTMLFAITQSEAFTPEFQLSILPLTAAVPEPSTSLLIGCGAAAVLLGRALRRKSTKNKVQPPRPACT
jgi:hypothetical protein